MAESGYPGGQHEAVERVFRTSFDAACDRQEAGDRAAAGDPRSGSESAKPSKGMAVTPGGGSSDEFRKMIDADIKTYVEVVKAANLKFEE